MDYQTGLWEKYLVTGDWSQSRGVWTGWFAFPLTCNVYAVYHSSFTLPLCVAGRLHSVTGSSWTPTCILEKIFRGAPVICNHISTFFFPYFLEKGRQYLKMFLLVVYGQLKFIPHLRNLSGMNAKKCTKHESIWYFPQKRWIIKRQALFSRTNKKNITNLPFANFALPGFWLSCSNTDYLPLISMKPYLL